MYHIQARQQGCILTKQGRGRSVNEIFALPHRRSSYKDLQWQGTITSNKSSILAALYGKKIRCQAKRNMEWQVCTP